MHMLDEFEKKFMDVIDNVLSHDLTAVDAAELGEVVDCLKDIEEAKYYKAVTEAMGKGDVKTKDIDRSRMYYHKPEDEMTLDAIMAKIEEKVDGASKDEKATMRQKLISYANKLV